MASNFWLDQAAQLPTQGQINQANMSSVEPEVPFSLMDPNAQMPAPAMVMPPPPAAPAVSPKHMAALQAYLPKTGMSGSPKTDAYADQANRALDDQKSTLKGLNDYINQIAAKPQGTNWTPLAAYVDSLTGSNFAPVAQKMAPETQDEKDKMLFGLKNQLAGGQAKFSADQLKALAEQQTLQHWQQLSNESQRHHLAEESKSGANGDAKMMMAQTRQDDQTSRFVDTIVKDKNLMASQDRVRGANRILEQLDAAKSGKIVDTSQLLADVNSELLLLMRGSSQTALGHLERTEYNSLQAKAASLYQSVNSSPTSINSPEILQQIRNQVNGLKGTYGKAIDMRADDLKRHARYNPDANDQMSQAINKMKTGYGESAPNPYSDVAEVKAHPQDNDAVAWARAHMSDPRAAGILKANGVQ